MMNDIAGTTAELMKDLTKGVHSEHLELISEDEDSGEQFLCANVVEQAVQMDYYLFRYIEKIGSAALAYISGKHRVKVKADNVLNWHGLKLRGFEKDLVVHASVEITKFVAQLNSMINKDSIDVSAFSDASFEITKAIKDIEENIKCVIFYYKDNIIHIIGVQEDIFLAKQELQYKLSVIQQNKTSPKRRNIDVSQIHIPPKRCRQLYQPSKAPITKPNFVGATYRVNNGTNIHILEGDITKLFVGAVVNAANINLQHGGGVADAISRAAGPELQIECSRYINQKGVLQPSDIYTSNPYNMPCQCIIHVVGPRWTDYLDKVNAEVCLRTCFLKVLAEADRHDLPSIAIPAVSSGIYGAPLNIVARTMLDAVCEFLKGSMVGKRIRNIILIDINTDILELLVLHSDQAVFNGNMCSVPADFEQFISSLGHVRSVNENDKGQENVKTFGASTFVGATPADDAEPFHSELAWTSKGRHHSMFDSGDDMSTDSALTVPIYDSLSQHKSESNNQSTQIAIKSTAKHPVEKTNECETCAICMESPTNKVVLSVCKHIFCKDCKDTWFKNKPTCPTCGQIYGEMKGNQPDGTMTTSRLSINLPGYANSNGTIVINYNFPDGKQEACHSNPGTMYRGTRRSAYLPDTAEGTTVLGLLRRAFDARLIFTIGRSATTGRDDQITWNDIHHKTNMSGGPAMFGYPDETYLRRVTGELAAKGIT